jgi:RNA polymerase sigma-70 factor (ECF subfamily)
MAVGCARSRSQAASQASRIPPLFAHTRSIVDDDAEQRRTAAAIRQLFDGDADGFSYLYSRYSGPVYSYVCTIVRDRDDAADVTQQVFLKLMTAFPQYDVRRARFAAWILRVARNAAIDCLRQSRGAVSTSEAIEIAQEDPTTRTDREVLRHALAALTDDQRKVLFLREHVGLPAYEVAQRLGKREAAVHTMHHRARLAARRRLLEMDVMPATGRSPRLARQPA